MGNGKQPKKRVEAKETLNVPALAGKLDELAGMADGAALLVDRWEEDDEHAAEIPAVIRSLCRQIAVGVRDAASELDDGAAASPGEGPADR
ncbi:MAG: hypothetical protein ACYDCL_18255 [Myxococcales bacterium]